MTVSKRKAWVYDKAAAPGMAALFGSPGERTAFFRYWVTDNIWNAAHVFAHYALKTLPMDACSGIGARLGIFAVPRFHKVAAGRARATIATLRPDLSEQEQEKIFRANCEAQGRLMTEFSLINRLSKNLDRLDIHDISRLQQSLQDGPVVLVGMHLGNWEIGSVVLQSAGIQAHAVYTPPRERAKAWIAERVRRKTGLKLIAPGHHGTRQAVKLLNQGKLISMFCDEGFAGKIRGPLFGRPVHQEGNLAVAVRLARLTGATICPWYSLRHDGFRFSCHFLEPIKLPAGQDGGERIADDIELLNAVIEPIVRSHLDQWFFVDHRL